MSVAKVVRLQARPGRSADLDMALTEAAAAADAEPGTRTWCAFLLPNDPESRLLIEVFNDHAAVDTHDRSAAVATLLDRFATLLIDDAQVQVYDRPVITNPEQPPLSTSEQDLRP